MRDPFKIEGPALISFSGGRTSGYMLWRCLQAHGGMLPLNVHVVFANTGKEREETLTFVHECATRWNVPVVWLEYQVSGGKAIATQVLFESASRNGEPFAALITKNSFQSGKAYLPNAVQRICTVEMKMRTMKRWMVSQGFEEWNNSVGLRADEPARVARSRTPSTERWTNVLPLADSGTTKADVMEFWASQDFDLQLRPWEGNCDLCFLKGADKIERILRDRPDLGTWWAERERETGARFRKDRPPYSRLLEIVQQTPPLLGSMFDDDHGAVMDCVCGEE